MRNALFYGLLVFVGAIVALIVYGAYLSVAGPGADPTQAVCGFAFIMVALVAWELLMKPRERRRPEPAEAPEEPGKGAPPGGPEGGAEPSSANGRAPPGP